MLNDPLGLGLPPISGAAQRIKRQVREIWDLREDIDVIVCEVLCREAGCPPRETVVLVHYPDGTKVERRWHKAIAALTRDDILALSIREDERSPG